MSHCSAKNSKKIFNENIEYQLSYFGFGKNNAQLKVILLKVRHIEKKSYDENETFLIIIK